MNIWNSLWFYGKIQVLSFELTIWIVFFTVKSSHEFVFFSLKLLKTFFTSLALDERSTEEEALGLKVHATDVLRVIETSILSFRQFVKMDKKKSGGVRSLFGSQNQMPTPVQLVQSTLEKVKLTLLLSH